MGGGGARGKRDSAIPPSKSIIALSDLKENMCARMVKNERGKYYVERI